MKMVKMITRLHPLCLAVAVGGAVYTNFVPLAAQDPTIPAKRIFGMKSVLTHKWFYSRKDMLTYNMKRKK